MKARSLIRLVAVLAVLLASIAPITVYAAEPTQTVQSLATAQEQAIQEALDWLKSQMADDGSFDPVWTGTTIDAIMAIYAAGEDPNTWVSGSGNSPVTYLEGKVPSYATDAMNSAKAALGTVASNRDPANFGGIDLIERVESFYNPGTGRYGSSIWDQAYSLMVLSAVCEPIPGAAIQALKDLQNGDGGWTFYDPPAPGWDTPNVDNTGLCVQALIGAGVLPTDTCIISATTFISNAQTTDGGFSWGAGPTSAPSTAVGIQGLIAANVNPLTGTFTISGTEPITDPLTALIELQSPEGDFGGYSAVQSTAQAIPGLVGRALPMRGRVAGALAALDWLRANQLDDGSWYGGSFATGVTLDAVFAIAAAGRDPNAWVSSDGNTPMDFLASHAITYTDVYTGGDPSKVGKLICGIVAGCGDPEEFGGRDWVAHLDGLYDSGTGQFGDRGWAVDSYWDILAEVALSQTVPTTATNWLGGEQQAKGGWYTADGSPQWDAVNTNDTAFAVQALRAAGEVSGSAVISDAIGYFHTQQQLDGGFCFADPPAPYWPPPESSPVNDALVIQALEAAGQDPIGPQWRTQLTATDSITMVIHNPVENLLSFQNAATGGFPGFFGGDDAMFTAQVIPALLGQPLPVYCHRVAAYLPLIVIEGS